MTNTKLSNTAMQPIENGPFFVVRTPRLSLEQLRSMSQSELTTEQQLNAWLAVPGVLEALYLASPSLLERIALWRDKPDSKQGKKVAQALLKYFIRMCSRPTPFGLFSGIHCGEVGNETALISGPHVDDKRSTRLDIFYLSALKEHFVKHASRSDSLKYKPNSSHYYVAEQCRYIETYLSDDNMQYRLSAVESDEYFKFALHSARSGVSFNELVTLFCTQYPDASQEEVEQYIQDLIDESVLQAQIPLPLTGESPDSALLKSLQAIDAHDTADHLATALAQVAHIDAKKNADIAAYKQIFAHLSELPVKVQENKLFQSDVYRHFEQCQLGDTELNRLKQQLELLAGLSAPPTGGVLTEFMAQFNARFEGQFVPLDVILDDESGIGISDETGYDAPLIAGLPLANKHTQAGPAAPPSSLLETLVDEALSLPANRAKTCVVLKSKELKSKVTNKAVLKQMPSSFAAMLSIFEDASHNPIVKFNGCYGPSSANLLGRFCHLEPTLKNQVVAQLQKEQAHSPDVIFAEVVHMPEGRPGNVIARPHLRDYEIVFMADSSLPDPYQITLSDLYVWVEGQQVKLWSKRLNKQVVPRLSSAHNYSARSLSAYKFLCMLQHQSGSAPNFHMPQSTARSAFVPRLMLDNLILSEKTWRIERSQLQAVVKNGRFDREVLAALMEKYQLDAQVCYAMGDNVLQLDLTHPDMFEILLAETKNNPRVELKEVLSNHYQSRVSDAQGNHYNNELIVPFFNPNAAQHTHFTDQPLANINAEPIKRRFSAGSQWLSLKIYSGNSLVEQLLSEQLLPMIEQQSHLYDKWFFIRYSDPDWHLRLRFFGEPQVLCGQLLPLLNQMLDPMIESGELHKVELMTYEREVERYGGPESMALVESLFMFDSAFIAKVCALIEECGESLRWRAALLYTDSLLTLFNYSSEQKLSLISGLREGFGKEFGDSSALRKQLGNRFREYETTLEDDFSHAHSSALQPKDESQEALLTLLAQWQKQAHPVVAQLNHLMENDALNCSRDALLGSLLHMHNNRMFKAYGREQELVIHDLLRRKYFSANRQQ